MMHIQGILSLIKAWLKLKTVLKIRIRWKSYYFAKSELKYPCINFCHFFIILKLKHSLPQEKIVVAGTMLKKYLKTSVSDPDPDRPKIRIREKNVLKLELK